MVKEVVQKTAAACRRPHLAPHPHCVYPTSALLTFLAEADSDSSSVSSQCVGLRPVDPTPGAQEGAETAEFSVACGGSQRVEPVGGGLRCWKRALTFCKCRDGTPATWIGGRGGKEGQGGELRLGLGARPGFEGWGARAFALGLMPS